MNNQTVNTQILENERAIYVKPNVEHHEKYTTVVGLPGSIDGFIGQPIDLISDPGLELIPDPVDIGI
jgi:hypothetical protein